jgi:hypothetical protein
MHIYIDESGSFVIPPNGRSKVCAVAALVIPTSRHDELLNEFVQIRDGWGILADEIKGSALDEAKIGDVISLLQKYDVLVEICAIDVGKQTEEQLTTYKQLQADKLIENLTPLHQPNVVDDVNRRRDYLLKMSNQLFVQVLCVIQTIGRVIEMATIYYSQRIPKELGEFHWIVDAKDVRVTESEQWWSLMMLPFMEAESITRPMMVLEEGDYSHFQRFVKVWDHVPERQRDVLSDADAPFEVNDVKMIMQESFVFADSKTKDGLQLVDIVASAFTRAMNGTLQKDGWANLGTLIIRRKPHGVRLISLNPNPIVQGKTVTQRNFHGYVMEQIDKNTKSI